MGDLLINLLASVIAGAAVWLAQFAIRRRRLERERAFFGLTAGATSLLVASRHASSPREESIHRRDVAALVELATIVRECGARADLVGGGQPVHELGRVAEFCVGGPGANPRAGTHLRAVLHGLSYTVYEWPAHGDGAKLAFSVGGQEYVHTPETGYAVLARFWGPADGRPVLYLGGLTAGGNLATARYLANHHRELFRRFGADRPFCLVLRIREPAAYGTDLTEIVADVSDVAFTAPPAPEGLQE
ncbi:hypothetical protein [Couchioplanes caeruleus]|uniref:Secreted protein n=2 Tax=Couchioplanes caeruleus TaxID=56438 RepID=A0A1K0FNF2_9ACTN|nr:hypothetical protein [Couchioplanes caeruleus]OJF14321.1 hypothetical protein BG844_10350 [Couchioplanes caeruleus subsp. caeruleus]ROP32864.1 hypothetical protein EDD30_5817 [Couchioplanes caeruleus]